jgi:hypothetical protein
VSGRWPLLAWLIFVGAALLGGARSSPPVA